MEQNKLLPISIIILAVSIIVSVVYMVANLPKSDCETDRQVSNESIVLSLDEVTDYLGLSREQILRMIQTEKRVLNETGVFIGETFPYLNVDGEYYFYKDSLDNWLDFATRDGREYTTTEGLVN